MRGFESPRFPGREANTTDMLLLLGVTKQKWPDKGVPARCVQGIWVCVLPVDHVQLGKQPGVRSVKHRVIAACPDCGKAVSAGRLRQHVCNSTRARRKPVEQARDIEGLPVQRASEHRHEHGGPDTSDALPHSYLGEDDDAATS